jgi:putative ABC transport system substrate-binding protein
VRRREFITLVGGAAVCPMVARGQQAAMPVIGFLSSRTPVHSPYLVAAFRQGLREVGYVEGQNVAIEFRWADDQNDRLPALAADLVRREVAVIATNSPAAAPAKAATTTIPIAFYLGNDPVSTGLVTSLNQPGGNLTGVTSLAFELGPKRLELLHELLPTATTIALLVNSANPNAETQSKDQQAAARALGLQLHVLGASTERDFETVFSTLLQLQAGGLVINGDAFLVSRSEQLAELALRHAVPAIFQFREFAAAGGLMSYGSSITDAYRLLGVYTGRVLNGEKPAELPVQQATKIELILNLKTAKALGLTIPLSLLGRADQVIE